MGTHGYLDVARHGVQADLVRPQGQLLGQVLLQSLGVALDLLEVRHLQVAAALGVLVDGEVLGWGAGDEVGAADGGCRCCCCCW